MNTPKDVMLEDVTCPLGCSKNDEVVLTGRDRLHDLPGEFTVVKCRTCGLKRTNPRPTPATIGAYYPADYAPYHSSTVEEKPSKSSINPDCPLEQHLIEKQRKFLMDTIRKPIKTDVLRPNGQSSIKAWLRHLLGLNARMLPPIPPGRMLEVGCASGSYMEQAKRLGWKVEGIEFSEEAAAVARGKGFNVQSGSLEQAKAPEAQYDVITAWMVLEHLHQPIFALKKLRKWVKPDGYLVALVPDAVSLSQTVFKELSYDLHLPAHLYHYSPKTLELVLANAGWEVERVFWQRNCNTLLWSFEYWATEKNRSNTLKFAKWLRLSKGAFRIRMILSILLGMARQSGRIEIWARPKSLKDGK